MKEFALSTIDNPFNPFEDFANWFLFDVEKGYDTCAYLARITRTSDSLSDEENSVEVERAIDEIVKNDFRGIYFKCIKEIEEENEEKTKEKK